MATAEEEKKAQTQALAITLSLMFGIIFGMIICYMLLWKKYNVTDNVSMVATFKTGARTIKEGADYLPSVVLLIITIMFTAGLAYIVDQQILGKNADKKKIQEGAQNAIGVSWALFIFSVVLIPYSLSSAKISLDSKYYLISSILVLYFATLATIFIFQDKISMLNGLSMDKMDLTKTHNLQLGLVAVLVAYSSIVLLMM
jgi:hypothetical protein